MPDKNLLSMLGLCMRGGMLAVGEEPVDAVSRAHQARLLLLAEDAADNTARRVTHFAQAGNCLWIRLPFGKDELGRALGRTSCALLAITDIGFASAFAKRLAQADPARYGETAEKLAVKAARAAQRKAEQLAHEKNLRQGRKRKSAPSRPQTEAQRPDVPAPQDPAGGPPKTRRKPQAEASRPVRGRSGPGAKPGNPRSKPPARRSSASARPYAHSRPVKKGKGSFRKADG